MRCSARSMTEWLEQSLEEDGALRNARQRREVGSDWWRRTTQRRKGEECKHNEVRVDVSQPHDSCQRRASKLSPLRPYPADGEKVLLQWWQIFRYRNHHAFKPRKPAANHC